MQHRYARLGYVAMNVSDLDRSAAFYEKLWGLEPNGEARDGARFFRCGPDHHHLLLCQGQPGLKRLSWQMESERDLDLLVDRLRGAGQEVVAVDEAEARDLRLGRAMRFSDPYTGATHEYFVTIEQAPDAWVPTLANIQRIGHVVLKTSRYEEALQFYHDVLNFKTSDAIEGRVTFMRCFPNPLHHSIGLGNYSANGLHHVNFMVEEIDDIGRAIWRFDRNDVPIVRGPGRHPPSNSVFLYALDPDGLTVEYSYGMEEFPERDAREHRVLPPLPESIDYWLGPTDPRLGRIGAIEPLR